MKLVVVIPSLDYTASAGARIRYGRIADSLAGRGIALTLVRIADFDPASVACDVALFSKCHDARALVCAHVLAQRGVPVGIDLFDDYFSQRGDSRLNRFRFWLRQMLGLCSFALVSTPAIRDVVRGYAPHLPLHILNDPAPPFDEPALAERLTRKRAEALGRGRLHVAWFGMGDNPHFAVGLRDLSAFAAHLSQLSSGSLAVDLSVLTNRRALDAAGLERIASLPVKTEVALWSEEREAALLDEALVAFLPVNANRFSRAKSLNRAVTALASGCQVLSPGFPLYAPLAPFIYDEAGELLDHLHSGALRLSGATLGGLSACLDQLASPAQECQRLEHFLATLGASGTPERRERDAIFLVHGAATGSALRPLLSSSDVVSVASPFCSLPWDFEVLFEGRHAGELAVFVAPRAARYLAPALRKTTKRVRRSGRDYLEVNPRAGISGGVPAHTEPLPVQLAAYPAVMAAVAQFLAANFDAKRIVLSEESLLPFTRDGADA